MMRIDRHHRNEKCRVCGGCHAFAVRESHETDTSTYMAAKACRKMRAAITLFEVVVSVAIFLFSVVVLVEIVSIGSQYAITAQRKSHGTLLCQSVMAEVMAGAKPMTGGDYSAFEDDGNANWQWKVETLPSPIGGLIQVDVFVRTNTGQTGEDEYYEVSLSRMVLDPMLRGTTSDQPIQPETMEVGDTPEESGDTGETDDGE